jgi:hypothetical protein
LQQAARAKYGNNPRFEKGNSGNDSLDLSFFLSFLWFFLFFLSFFLGHGKRHFPSRQPSASLDDNSPQNTARQITAPQFSASQQVTPNHGMA